MKCETIMEQKCSNSHKLTWRCFQGTPKACQICERERKAAEKKAKKALEDKLRRDEKKQKYLKEIAKIDEEIEQLVQGMKDAGLESEQANILAQKRKDLQAAKERGKKAADVPQRAVGIENEGTSGQPQVKAQTNKATPAPGIPKSTSQGRSQLRQHTKIAVEHNKSPSKTEWQRQKDQENAANPAIDDIMSMIGLEDVKSQVLRIKSKVETSIRQNTDLKKERLGLVLLGNPGTGK